MVPPPVVRQPSIEVLPGMPDPNSGKIHRLQVGAFSTPEGAATVAQQMRNAGFYVQEERNGGMYRVVVVNIPASVVHLAVERFAALGITQVWVRD
jgi:cell division protein FtsN